MSYVAIINPKPALAPRKLEEVSIINLRDKAEKDKRVRKLRAK